MVDLTDDELLAELGVIVEAKPAQTYTPRQERVIAGFEDIVRFFEEHGRAPQHGEQRDIFERLYAVRLDCLRGQEDSRALLVSVDKHGLLDVDTDASLSSANLDDDALLAELGIDVGETATDDITQLRHVQTREERHAAEEIANRERCSDFETFKPKFDQVTKDLELGIRETRQIRKDAGFLKTDIKTGEFFVVNGQTLYIAEVGEPIKAPNGENDARLRAIYSNGTESNLLLRSLQRAIYKDETSRCITDPGDAGPLFASVSNDDDTESGTIYVLRSKSNHPLVTQHRELIHKIGVTGGSVASRIAGANNDATYLLAGVEVVAEYKLFNINRLKLEQLIHRFFAEATLDIEIMDRFGKPVRPKEWFLVPLHVVDEMVKRIRDGTIGVLWYEVGAAKISNQAQFQTE